ncbi:hypothetical protein YO5_18182 [Stutzerimonas stutzeri TS44]|nr:hypothetical protein YO5_18182 [Stutzerimonas stutzeri TS44]
MARGIFTLASLSSILNLLAQNLLNSHRESCDDMRVMLTARREFYSFNLDLAQGGKSALDIESGHKSVPIII